MVTDIHGWIECKRAWEPADKPWHAVISTDWLVDPDYDAFACFFGVRNYAQFRPIADYRGIPDGASKKVQKEAAPSSAEYHNHTWITWAEIKAIDWEEEAEAPDERLHTYIRNEQGELVYEKKAVWSRDWSDMKPTPQALAAAATPEGVREWENPEGKIIRAEVLKRKAAFDWGYRLFPVMEALAVSVGEERVRLVVWFDS